MHDCLHTQWHKTLHEQLYNPLPERGYSLSLAW